jgi:hypothetical protein
VSGSLVSIRLQTLCGCTKHMLVPRPAPDSIEVPILALGEGQRFTTRTFVLNSQSSSDGAAVAEYVEVPADL